MAYQSRLAKLLLESEQVLHKRKQPGDHSEEPAVSVDAIKDMLEEVEQVVQSTGTGEEPAQGKSVDDLIQQGLMQRRKKKKHKVDTNTAAGSEDTLPLDLLDWRARTF